MMERLTTFGMMHGHRLNERYEAWIHDYDKKNLIILEVDDLNFVDNPEDLQKVVEVIDDKLGIMKMDAK